MPATALQIEANRANAALSTGPRTPEGKAASAQNATRHGLGAATPLVLPGEQEAFAALQAELAESCRPSGAIESLIFSRLVHAAWNLRRCDILEDSAPPNEPNPTVERYAARAERTMFRCLKELRTLQTERALREEAARQSYPLPAEAVDDIPPLASFKQVTNKANRSLRPGRPLAQRPAPLTAKSSASFIGAALAASGPNEANSMPGPASAAPAESRRASAAGGRC